MSNSWNLRRETGGDLSTPLRVHLFVSRNKDNAGVDGYRPRRCARLAYDSDTEAMADLFADFIAKGWPGEVARWYASVNARDPELVRRGLMHRLVDGADPAHLESLAVSVAGKAECAAEHRWLFDFDEKSARRVADFTRDVYDLGDFASGEVERRATPNGFAVVVPHGFDTRELMSKWGSVVELKRDGLLFREWRARV